jgi:cell wall-associated NlpC family hydrolase
VANPYPGDQATRQQVAAWMANHARAAGLPAELPVMAGLVESGLRNLNHGDRDSLGFFQMRRGIWDQGAYQGYAQNPELQMKWFIDTALKADRGANLGEWVANIERPAEQYRGRYQQRLAEARALVGGAQPAAAGGLVESEPGALGGIATPAAAPQTSQRFARFNALQPMLARNAKLAKIPEITIPESLQLRVEMDEGPADTTPQTLSPRSRTSSAANGSTTPPRPDQLGQALVESAKQFLGIPYSWGGGSDKGPTKGIGRGANTVGFDCSSLMKAIYAKFGIQIPRVTYDQFRAGKPVDPAAAAPGDLLFFNPDQQGPGHVGISIGNGQFLHAPRTGDVVKISSLASRSDLVGVRRYR